MCGTNPLNRFIALLCVLLLTHAGITHACRITVTDNGDAPLGGGPTSDRDNKITFREAIDIGLGRLRCYSDFERGNISGANFVPNPLLCGVNTTQYWSLSGSNPGCGPNDADRIVFADGINGGRSITLGQYVSVDPRDSIDGGTATPNSGVRPNVELRGAATCPTSAGAIVMGDLLNPVDATGEIVNLYVTGFCGNAVWAPRVNGFRVSNVVFSSISFDSVGEGDALALGDASAFVLGTQNCVFSAQIGGTGTNEQNYFYGIAGDAISLRDNCTGDLSNRNNKIFNNYIGMCEELDTGFGFAACDDNTQNQGIGRSGIYLLNTNGTQIGGPGAGEANYIGRANNGGISIAGNNSIGNSVRGNHIGVARQQDYVRPNGTGVVISDGADNNVIGGTGAGEGNTISGNNSRGVTIDGAGTSGNRVTGNIIGMNTARTLVRANGDGIGITSGADSAQIDDNIIAGNSLWGIYVNAGGGHSIHDNIIGLRGSVNNANDNTAAPNGNGGVWINDVGGDTVWDNRIAGNNGPGVQVAGENADGNVIRGNIIGLDNANLVHPNTGDGVYVLAGADNTLIGGTTSADRNIISGNANAGVRISGNTTDATTVSGNFVGTDLSGNLARANGAEGIRIDSGASHTTVSQNLVSGNGNDGIKLESGATQSHIMSNTVGVMSTISVPLPNAASGISILSGANNNLIDSANVVAGNTGAGIFVADSGTLDNIITNNIIGAGGLPNATGIVVTANAGRTQILANAIRSNTGNGVAVFGNGTVKNPILDNLFDRNGGLGIDLGGDGVTANDAGDNDSGPNHLQNFPTLGNIVIGTNQASMSVSLGSDTNHGYTITLYRSDHCDTSGFGEGQFKLGSTTLNTGGNGSGSVIGLLYSVPNSQTKPSWGTAIATATNGDTSEFGPCMPISDEIFPSGFQTSGPVAPAAPDEVSAEIPAASTASDSAAILGVSAHIEQHGDGASLVTLSVVNATASRLPRPTIGVTTSSAIVVEDAHVGTAQCALAGRIECRLPTLGPGETVAIELRLMPLDHAATTLSVVGEIAGKPSTPRTFVVPAVTAP